MVPLRRSPGTLNPITAFVPGNLQVLLLSIPLLVGCVLLKRNKAESEAQRGKPKGTLESESRNAIQQMMMMMMFITIFAGD